MNETAKTLAAAVKELQTIRMRLQEAFENQWQFPLDGLLVGDIGEAYAVAHFDLHPLGETRKVHDFKTSDGKKVQVKITQKKRLGLGLSAPTFDYLLAFFLTEDGNIELLYNGKGSRVYSQEGKTARKSIAVTMLRKLNKKVPDDEKISSR